MVSLPRARSLSRSTTAFHLDRLADEGLLEVEYRRLSGKTGPGSGRPSKPMADGNDVVLGNCPFAALAQRHTGLVCDVNYHLVQGMEEAAGDSHTVLSEPGAGRCCVRVTPRD